MTVRPSILFLIVAFLFGSLSIYLTPPFQSPDETNHFHRVIHISEGHLMGKKLDGNRLGGVMDIDALSFTQLYDSIRKSDHPKFKDIDEQPYNKDNPNAQKIFVDFANVGYYSPTVYIPQVLGVGLAKVLNLGIHDQFYIGRWSGFLAWLLIVFSTIRITPIGKNLLLFLGLLPASISLHCTLSGDIFSNALCFLWIALMLRAILSDHFINWKEWAGLMIIISLITINKLVYFPLALMIFMIPSHNIVKPLWTKGLLISLVVFILLSWIPYSKSMFIPYDFYDVAYRDAQQLNTGVRPDEQFRYIISHPFSFVKTVIVSYVESAPSTWSHYVGKFGWEKNYIPFSVIGLLTIVLVGISLSRMKNELSLTVLQRIQILGIAFLMMAGFTVSIYMQWSPVGNDRVWSLSGRYFISIIPLFLLALPKYEYLKEWKLNQWTFLFSVLGLVVLLWSMWNRFY